MRIDKTNALKMTCTACGKTRKRKGITYHPVTFEPYCENPYACTVDHPLSQESVTKRAIEHGSAAASILTMLSYEEAQPLYEEWLKRNHTDEEMTKLKRVATRPTTFRVANYETAEFLIQYQEAVGAKSISDVVRLCIEQVMQDFQTGVKEMPVKPIPPDEMEAEEIGEDSIESTETVEEEWSI